MKQKGSKKADLVEAGAMVFDRAWCNAGEVWGDRAGSPIQGNKSRYL